MLKESFDKINGILHGSMYWERNEIRYVPIKLVHTVIETFSDVEEAKKINTIISASITSNFISDGLNDFAGVFDKNLFDLNKIFDKNYKSTNITCVSLLASLAVIKTFISKETETTSLLNKLANFLEKCQCSKDAASLHKDISAFLEKKP